MRSFFVVPSVFWLILISLIPTSSSFSIVVRSPGLPARHTMTQVAFSSKDELESTTSLDDSLRDEVLDQILEVAIEASKKAGEIILGNAGGAEIAERKANSRDLLTLIDPLCEKVRTAVLTALGMTTQALN